MKGYFWACIWFGDGAASTSWAIHEAKTWEDAIRLAQVSPDWVEARADPETDSIQIGFEREIENA